MVSCIVIRLMSSEEFSNILTPDRHPTNFVL